jgi:hypothetical protein
MSFSLSDLASQNTPNINPFKLGELIFFHNKIQASKLFAIFVVFHQSFQKASKEVIASERAKISRTLKVTLALNYAIFSLFSGSFSLSERKRRLQEKFF